MTDTDRSCPDAQRGARIYLAILLGSVLAVALGLAGFSAWLAPPNGDLVRIGGLSARSFGWQQVQTGFAQDHYDETSVPDLLRGVAPGDILVFGDSFSTKQRGGISWINTLHMRTGHAVRFVRFQDFREIRRYLDSNAFRTAPPGAVIIETVERETVRRGMAVHAPDLPCVPPGPARAMPAAQAAPLDLPRREFTRRTRFDSFDELFSWGALAIRIRLKGDTDAAVVMLNRTDLFSNRAPGQVLIYRDDILRHTADAFPGRDPGAAAEAATCGLRQLVARAGAVPVRIVIAPDKRSVYADWITTPLPEKAIDVFALARAALDDVFVDLRDPLHRATATTRDIYYPDDSHWGGVGHGIAGTVVATALAQPGVN